MSWERLNEKGMGYICQPSESGSTEALKALMEKYNLVDYSSYAEGTPIMYFLKRGNFVGCYSNPQNSTEFHEKYGVDKVRDVFRYPLWDHVWAFRDVNRKGYLVLNPYLRNEEIEAFMDQIKLVSWQYGDYSDLKYDILGKDKSFYNPGHTNIVVLYM